MTKTDNFGTISNISPQSYIKGSFIITLSSPRRGDFFIETQERDDFMES